MLKVIFEEGLQFTEQSVSEGFLKLESFDFCFLMTYRHLKIGFKNITYRNEIIRYVNYVCRMQGLLRPADCSSAGQYTHTHIPQIGTGEACENNAGRRVIYTRF